jgi:glucosamine--fructose-6-phosphate aminotransferase (isomerizing)
LSDDRVAILRNDLMGGPAALAALLDTYEVVGGPLDAIADRPRRVAFVGLGSSRYAGLGAAAALRSAGIAAWAEYASTAAPTEPADDLTLVAVSASGTTGETVEAARRHRGRSRVVAVTNEPESALAGVADHVLPLLAGREGAGIATRTFRATVAVLGLLAGRWLADDRSIIPSGRPAVAALGEVIQGHQAWLSAAADLFDHADAIDVIGDAADVSLVQQAALMFREAPRLPAEAHDTGDWLHTSVYLAFPGHRALLFSGAATDADVVTAIRRRGGAVVVVGDPVDGATLTIPLPVEPDRLRRVLVGSVVAELLSAELWARTNATETGMGERP